LTEKYKIEMNHNPQKEFLKKKNYLDKKRSGIIEHGRMQALPT